MNGYIHNIDIEYDKDKLISEANLIDFKPFELPEPRGSWFDYVPTWLQGRVSENNTASEVFRIADIISNKIGTKDIRPRFYKQDENTELPMHSDNGTLCAINIILSDDFAPIVFEKDGAHTYNCAILNVQERHSVPAFHKQRFLIKYSIFDVSYAESIKRWNK